jgi:hypothetical protein
VQVWRFLQEWTRLLGIAKSAQHRTTAIVGNIVAVLVFIKSVLDAFPLQLPFQFTWGGVVLSIPQIPALVIAAAWLTVFAATGGAAWVLSRGLPLSMGEQLELDPEHQMYRLRLHNKSRRLASGTVKVLKILDREGNELVPQSLLPLPLEWSYHPKQSRVEVCGSGGEETVGVAGVWLSGGSPQLFLYGAEHQQNIGPETEPEQMGKVFLLLSLEVGGGNQARWFCLEPDSTSPAFYVATREAPPAC